MQHRARFALLYGALVGLGLCVLGASLVLAAMPHPRALEMTQRQIVLRAFKAKLDQSIAPYHQHVGWADCTTAAKANYWTCEVMVTDGSLQTSNHIFSFHWGKTGFTDVVQVA